MVVYAYGGNKAGIWWAKIGNALARCENLSIFELPRAATSELAALAERGMNIACLISDREMWLSDARKNVGVEPTAWMNASANR